MFFSIGSPDLPPWEFFAIYALPLTFWEHFLTYMEKNFPGVKVVIEIQGGYVWLKELQGPYVTPTHGVGDPPDLLGTPAGVPTNP